MNWEIIQAIADNDAKIYSDRLWVPTGWIVRSFRQDYFGGGHVCMNQILVEDFNHEWKLKCQSTN